MGVRFPDFGVHIQGTRHHVSVGFSDEGLTGLYLLCGGGGAPSLSTPNATDGKLCWAWDRVPGYPAVGGAVPGALGGFPDDSLVPPGDEGLTGLSSVYMQLLPQPQPTPLMVAMH